MAAVGKARSGKNSRTQVEGVNLCFASWKTTDKGDDLDTTNFESLGNDQGTIGVIGTDWTMGGDFDAGRNPFDSPPGLYVRDDMGSVVFYTNVNDNVGHFIPDNRVISAENGAEVRGKVTFNATGKSQGISHAISNPTGSV